MVFKVTTIDKFATVQGGYAYKSGDFQAYEKWPVLKIKNIRAGSVDYSDVAFVSEHIAAASSKWKTAIGDILISMTGSGPSAPASLVGRVAKIRSGDPVALINQRIGRLVIKDNADISQSFLYHVLSMKETQNFLVANATGSANQVNISAKIIGSVPCPDVDLRTSINIANFLDALDDRITLLLETNETLEAIAQALFKSWFVDFDPVRAKQEGRQAEGIDDTTAALFPNSFEQSDFGEIPKGWQKGKLADLADFQNGYAFKGKDWTESGHPVIKIGNVKPRLISFDGCSFISKETIQGLDRFKLKRGDLLVGMTGYVGETGLVSEVSPAAYLNQRVGKFSTSAGLKDIGFVYCLTRRNEFKVFAEDQSHGSAQANVSGTDLLNLPIIKPNPQILSTFNLIVYPIIDAIISNSEIAQTLSNLRDTLLPRLISGQLRLTDKEEKLLETID